MATARMTPDVVFGSIAELPARLRARGARRVLVLASSGRHVDAVTAALTEVPHAVFEGARVHVPVEVVEAAEVELAGHDAMIAVGGGSAIGLAKALRLRRDVGFVAIPTTYAGSEMTALYGVTRGRDKQTGRDERVRPDLIVYDVALTTSLPRVLTTQSLINALAHVVSVLSTRSLTDGDRQAALTAARDVVEALDALEHAPADRAARELALRGASACATAIDRGTPGAQHGLAHVLGGATGTEHAPLHAVLLPAFIAHVRRTDPDVIDGLERAVGREALDAYLRARLAAAGAPGSLTALGLERATVDAALATRPGLPADVAYAAL